MSATPLRMAGFVRGSHADVVVALRDTLTSSGAFILDYHMFSNAILCLDFEISAAKLPQLKAAMADAMIQLDPQSVAALRERCDSSVNAPMAANGRIAGSLSIRLIHDDPDLRIDVPAIPG